MSNVPRWAWVIWALALLLAVLHQDLWNWDDRTLVLGIVPVGLFYHAMFTLAATMLWALGVRLAWPRHIEQWAEEVEAPAPKERHP